MRGRGAPRKAEMQRSVSPDGNRINKGEKGNNVIDYEQQLREAEYVPNSSSAGMVPSEVPTKPANNARRVEHHNSMS
ncbi:hypothetical protein DPMN_042613 [Dreissena polymorpha]|uniref:Uncharacterized protein n=1 Tax=Dreissena polymorpha TaxID=45954 RepID=A0A9D4D2C9_DREPO|nr:hypothetical protein DPMN_042613 [Dreissena polymorpha]